MKEVYLDNGAGTPADPRVIRAMARAMREPGNPASFNDAGRRARTMLEQARARVARFMNARPGEVVFFASASAANAAAFRGVTGALRKPGHLVSVSTEHRSVLDQVARFVRQGWKADIVGVDGQGMADTDDLIAALGPRTILVSVMYANNEIGAIAPIKDIAKAIRAHRKRTGAPYPYLHVDAAQATAYLPMDVQALGADLVTISGAKAHGPRSIAALFVRRGIRMAAEAESADMPSAVGLAHAVGLVRPADSARVARLRDRAIARLMEALPDARLNGPTGIARLANNISISIPGASSEELLLELDKHGIRAGSGSACTAHSVESSHVLRAIGLQPSMTEGTVRLSLSRSTSQADIDRLVRMFPRAVASVRRRRLK